MARQYGQLMLGNIPGQMQQGRQDAQRNQMGRLAMDQQRRSMAQQDRTNALVGGMGQVSPEKREPYLASLAAQGPQGRDASSQMREVFGEMDERQRAEKRERAKRIRRQLAGVEDQQSYDVVRQEAVEANPQMAERLPEEYDPNAVEPLINQFREVEDILGDADVKSAQGAFSQSLADDGGSGNFVAARTDEGVQRQLTDDQGNVHLVAPPDDFQLVDTSVTGTPDEVLPSGEQTKLRDEEIATKNFIDTAGDAMSILEENPDVNTFAARGASLINDLQQESKAGARAAGLEFDDNVFAPSKYAGTFDELGIENKRMKSLLVSLSFQAASASGQTGRSVSDKDVERFMRQIGADAADPRAMSRVLRDVANRSARNFRNSFETRMRRPYEGDVGLTDLPSGLPDGIPQGSSQIGNTQDGLPVYETPDGKQLVVE